MTNIRKEFAFHKLNTAGQARAIGIAEVFTSLLERLEQLGCDTKSREFAVTKTKLEEACFFAKKSMAVATENQEPQP